MFYSMFATAYDPAVAAIFSVTPAQTRCLTSSRIYETGVKQLFWDGKAEWTIAAYDILQRNVFVPVNTTTTDVAGEVASKGIEVAAAVRPFDGWKLWGNAAFTHARFVNFDAWTGNTPSNVAPVIVNAGASYRFNHWRWPVELGGSVRHVGNRYLLKTTTDDAECLYDGGRLCVRRHSEPGSGASRNRQPARHLPRAQRDRQGLRRVVRYGLSGSGSARRAAHLRNRCLGAVVKYSRTARVPYRLLPLGEAPLRPTASPRLPPSSPVPAEARRW